MNRIAYAVMDSQGRLWGDRWREPFSATKPPKIWARKHDAVYRLGTLERYAKWSDPKDRLLPFSVVEVGITVKESL